MSPLLVLIVAVLATTYAGPIVRFAAAPALAIAFWRLAMVLPVTGGLAVLEGSRERGAGSRRWGVALLPAPGSLLPLITLSGLLPALPFWSRVAAAVLALLALAHAAPLIGFPRRDWAVFGAMAAGPMLIGHTGMNYALRHFRATTVNVAALGEPVGASVIAWLMPAIHETPRATTLGGGLLVLIGIGLSLGAGSREQGAVPAPAAEGTAPRSPLRGRVGRSER